MFNLNDLTAKELKQVLKLRQKIEAIERQMGDVLKGAQKRKPTLAVAIRSLALPRKAQPNLRDLIGGILAKATEPMSVPEIYDASLAAGYQWRSQDPINALNVKMYTDNVFKKVAPGRFLLRRKPKK